jgi:hypothetical protein
MERIDADPDDSRDETIDEKHDRNWGEILQELRVTQTGTQILGGFLLALAFQPRFVTITPGEKVLYLIFVGLAGLSTALGLAPVILHRTFFNRHMKGHVVKLGNRLLLAEIVVVGLLAIGVTAFLFDVVIGHVAGIITGIVAFLIVATLWVVLPQVRKRMA